MNDFQSILDHTVPFLLVLFRLSGLFVFAPVLSGTILPPKVRVLMCVMLAAGMYPAVAHHRVDWSDLDVLSLGWIVAGETLIGVAIGLVASLPIYAAQLGGLMMGQQMGMGLANVYNPAMDVEGDTLGQLLLFMAMTVFIALGGLEVLFLTVAGSFAAIPAGFALTGGGNDVGAFSAVWLDLLVGVMDSGMSLAVRVAAPVLCIIMLETVAMGFVMKTMPQLNVLTIGFAVKVLIALVGLVLALKAIEQSMHEEVVEVMRAVVRVFGGGG